MKYFLLDVVHTLHAQIVVRAESPPDALEAFHRTPPEVLSSVVDLQWNAAGWDADDEEPRELNNLDDTDADTRCFAVESDGLVDVGAVWDLAGGDTPAGMPTPAAEALAKDWDVEFEIALAETDGQS